MVLVTWCTLLALAAAKRELFEIGPDDQDVGLEPFYEGNMEPWGVVCVGYVKEGSPKHMLLKKLAAVSRESDQALFELQADSNDNICKDGKDT